MKYTDLEQQLEACKDYAQFHRCIEDFIKAVAKTTICDENVIAFKKASRRKFYEICGEPNKVTALDNVTIEKLVFNMLRECRDFVLGEFEEIPEI